MKPKEFFKQLDDDKIVAAIHDAEQKTSGEIRVFVSQKEIGEPVAAAQSAFEELGMIKTRDRNGVLIFVAPRTQTFAVIGDEGVHKHCGEEFWKLLAAEMTHYFKQSDFTSGIVHAVHKAGEVLGSHFPRRPDDTNELPNRVVRD